MDRKNGNAYKKMIKLKVKGYNFLNYEKILGELELDVSNYVGSFKRNVELELQKSVPNSKVKLEITV